MRTGRRFSRSRRGPVVVLLAACLVAAAVPGVAQLAVSGSNALTVSFAGLPQALDAAFRDVLLLSCRIGDASITSRTTFSMSGLEAEDLRGRVRLAGLTVQSAVSFRDQAMARAGLDVLGSWEGVSYTASLLVADLDATSGTSYDSGGVLRFSGVAPGLGYLSATVGIGASPFGLVVPGWCFEGARILVSDLGFCEGKAAIDVTFGRSGPEFEVVTWKTPLPFRDFALQVAARFADLLSFQSLITTVRGSIGDLEVAAYVSFDETLGLTFGTVTLGGPLLGGTLSSSTAFDATALRSEVLTWSIWEDGLFLVLGPQIAIDTIDGDTIAFRVPSIQADVRWDLTCCDGIEVGELGLSLVIGGQTFDWVSVTYTYNF